MKKIFSLFNFKKEPKEVKEVDVKESEEVDVKKVEEVEVEEVEEVKESEIKVEVEVKVEVKVDVKEPEVKSLFILTDIPDVSDNSSLDSDNFNDVGTETD